jgi:antitoxin CptB
MKNKELLKKQIIYTSMHRGFKEMDLLLGNFVKKYVNKLEISDLIDLKNLLFLEDEIIYNWYFKKKNELISQNKVTKLLKNFKL